MSKEFVLKRLLRDLPVLEVAAMRVGLSFLGYLLSMAKEEAEIECRRARDTREGGFPSLPCQKNAEV